LAEESGKPLNGLSLSELQSVDPTFGKDALKVFNLQRALSARRMTGAPGWKQVKSQLTRWQKALKR
jgi:argininosuccinate lyase